MTADSGTDIGMDISKKEERRIVLFLTVFLFPLLTVLFIAGYGFVVWILQMIFGPPSA